MTVDVLEWAKALKLRLFLHSWDFLPLENNKAWIFFTWFFFSLLFSWIFFCVWLCLFFEPTIFFCWFRCLFCWLMLPKYEKQTKKKISQTKQKSRMQQAWNWNWVSTFPRRHRICCLMRQPLRPLTTCTSLHHRSTQPVRMIHRQLCHRHRVSSQQLRQVSVERKKATCSAGLRCQPQLRRRQLFTTLRWLQLRRVQQPPARRPSQKVRISTRLPPTVKALHRQVRK